MVNNILLISLKSKLLGRIFLPRDSTKHRQKLTYHDHILRSQRASQSKYAKIVPFQAFEDEDNRLFACEQVFSKRIKLSKEELSGVYNFFSSEIHKSALKQLILFITRSNQTKTISESTIRKLEDDTKASIRKKNDEVVALMYRMMKNLAKERRQMLKETMLKSKYASTKYSGRHSTENCTHKAAMWASECRMEKKDPENVCHKVPTVDESKHTHLDDTKTERLPSQPRSASGNGKHRDRHRGSRFSEVNEKHCETVAKMVSARLFGEIQTTYPSVQLFIQRSDDSLAAHHRMAVKWSEECLGAFFFPYDTPGTICTSFVEDMRDFVFGSLFKGSKRVPTMAGKCFRFETFEALAVLAVVSEISPLIKHKDLCLLDTLSLIVGVPREALVVVTIKDTSNFRRPHSLPFTSMA